MARNLITRTVTTTRLTALVADKAAAEFFNKSVDVLGKVKPEKCFQGILRSSSTPGSLCPS